MTIKTNILETIGKTPLIRLNKLTQETNATVIVKLESKNPGGSVKDRICKAMIEEAEKQGLLKPGATIIEPTSGNTGIGLAMVAAVKGYKLILTMPETMSIERRNLLKAYGAQLILTPGPEGMGGAIKKAEELASQTPNSFIPQQFKQHSAVNAFQGLLHLLAGDNAAVILAQNHVYGLTQFRGLSNTLRTYHEHNGQ